MLPARERFRNRAHDPLLALLLKIQEEEQIRTGLT
jgi:hypothetical protein